MTIGFDFGQQTCVAGVTQKNAGKVSSGGNFIHITLDEGSKRSVAPSVGFPKKERTFGAVASKQFKKNINKTIRNPLRLLGKTFEDCKSSGIWNQTESTSIVPGFQTAGGRTTAALEINYQGENIHVAPEHAVAMMLRHQVAHCKIAGVQSNECCVSIPNNCTYTTREALANAVRLADLNPLKLASSTECLALDYGLLGGKARGPEMATLFLDFGHSGVNAGVVRFFDGGWDIIAQDTYEGFSGSFLDGEMIKFFANEFEKQHGSNFLSNAKAVNKVESRLGKLKKNLVVNQVASNTIDFLFDGEDFTCRISREEMWGLCSERAEEFLDFLRTFLAAAKDRLKGDVKFEAIECVGGVSRMVDLRARLSEVLQEEIGNGKLQNKLNTDEAIARGCVLQCAILSPRFAIQERKVKNVVPFSVLVGRQPSDFPIDGWKDCNYETLFPVWSELGKTKSITFKKPKSLRILLVEENTKGKRNLIGFVDINSERCILADAEKWKKFQVIVDLDNSGLLAFRVELTKSRVELVDVAKEIDAPKSEEEYAADVEKAQTAARVKAEALREKAIATYKKKMEERKAKAEAVEVETPEKGDGDGDVVMEEKKPEAEEELKNPEEEELVVPEVNVSKVKKETKVEKVEKTQVIKEDVPCVFTSIMGMLPETETSIRSLEAKQAAYDIAQVAIQKARNDLECYVLEAQGEYCEGGTYFEFMTEAEYENFINLIFEMEEYVSDDNFDKPISEYEAKLASLTIFGDVYKARQIEWEKRPKALQMCKKLLTQIEMFLAEGHSTPDYEHIGEELLTPLVDSCRDANVWLDERQQFHDRTGKQQDAPYLSSEISAKISEINSPFAKVKRTPKPEPAKEEEKKTEEKTEKPAEEKDVDVEMKPEPKAEAEATETGDVDMGEN